MAVTTTTLVDVRVVDTDAPSYAFKSVTDVLCMVEGIKKNKYSSASAMLPFCLFLFQWIGCWVVRLAVL